MMGERGAPDQARGARERRIADLKAQIADLEARLPKHSIPPAMLIELEDLEEALERVLSEKDEGDNA